MRYAILIHVKPGDTGALSEGERQAVSDESSQRVP